MRDYRRWSKPLEVGRPRVAPTQPNTPRGPRRQHKTIDAGGSGTDMIITRNQPGHPVRNAKAIVVSLLLLPPAVYYYLLSLLAQPPSLYAMSSTSLPQGRIGSTSILSIGAGLMSLAAFYGAPQKARTRF